MSHDMNAEDQYRQAEQAEADLLLSQKAYIGGEGGAAALLGFQHNAADALKREQALNLAASLRHGTNPNATDVLADAKAYFKFLSGDDA